MKYSPTILATVVALLATASRAQQNGATPTPPAPGPGPRVAGGPCKIPNNIVCSDNGKNQLTCSGNGPLDLKWIISDGCDARGQICKDQKCVPSDNQAGNTPAPPTNNGPAPPRVAGGPCRIEQNVVCSDNSLNQLTCVKTGNELKWTITDGCDAKGQVCQDKSCVAKPPAANNPNAPPAPRVADGPCRIESNVVCSDNSKNQLTCQKDGNALKWKITDGCDARGQVCQDKACVAKPPGAPGANDPNAPPAPRVADGPCKIESNVVCSDNSKNQLTCQRDGSALKWKITDGCDAKGQLCQNKICVAKPAGGNDTSASPPPPRVADGPCRILNNIVCSDNSKNQLTCQQDGGALKWKITDGCDARGQICQNKICVAKPAGGNDTSASPPPPRVADGPCRILNNIVCSDNSKNQLTCQQDGGALKWKITDGCDARGQICQDKKCVAKPANGAPAAPPAPRVADGPCKIEANVVCSDNSKNQLTCQKDGSVLKWKITDGCDARGQICQDKKCVAKPANGAPATVPPPAQGSPAAAPPANGQQGSPAPPPPPPPPAAPAGAQNPPAGQQPGTPAPAPQVGAANAPASGSPPPAQAPGAPTPPSSSPPSPPPQGLAPAPAAAGEAKLAGPCKIRGNLKCNVKGDTLLICGYEGEQTGLEWLKADLCQQGEQCRDNKCQSSVSGLIMKGMA